MISPESRRSLLPLPVRRRGKVAMARRRGWLWCAALMFLSGAHLGCGSTDDSATTVDADDHANAEDQNVSANNHTVHANDEEHDDAAQHDDGSHHGGTHAFSLPQLPFLLFMLFTGAALRSLIVLMPEKVQPPYTVCMGTLGFLYAAIDRTWAGELGHSLELWEAIPPELILYVLLPPLLFESAFAMDWHVFVKVFSSSILLAGPGVLLATGMSGAACMLIFSDYDGDDGWGWSSALMLGAILSATDPVAVVATLHELGAPKKLGHLIEGESLLNDGTAFVIFLVFKDMAGGKFDAPHAVAGKFVQLAAGGPIVGAAAAYATSIWLRHHKCHGDAEIEITALTVAVLVIFFVSEQLLHVSGVLAVVAFGILIGKNQASIVGRKVMEKNHAWWTELCFIANSLIFGLAGVIIYKKFTDGDHNLVERGAPQLVRMLMVYVALHIIRGVVVFGFQAALLHRLGYGLSRKEAVVCVYGGLRGAVGLALALEVEHDTLIASTTRTLVTLHVSATVVLTLLVNGTTTAMLYNWLDIYPESSYQQIVVKHSVTQLDRDTEKYLASLNDDGFHSKADWETVEALVPRLSTCLLIGHSAVKSDGQLADEGVLTPVRTLFANLEGRVSSNLDRIRRMSSSRENSMAVDSDGFSKLLKNKVVPVDDSAANNAAATTVALLLAPGKAAGRKAGAMIGSSSVTCVPPPLSPTAHPDARRLQIENFATKSEGGSDATHNLQLTRKHSMVPDGDADKVADMLASDGDGSFNIGRKPSILLDPIEPTRGAWSEDEKADSDENRSGDDDGESSVDQGNAMERGQKHTGRNAGSDARKSQPARFSRLGHANGKESIFIFAQAAKKSARALRSSFKRGQSEERRVSIANGRTLSRDISLKYSSEGELAGGTSMGTDPFLVVYDVVLAAMQTKFEHLHHKYVFSQIKF